MSYVVKTCNDPQGINKPLLEPVMRTEDAIWNKMVTRNSGRGILKLVAVEFAVESEVWTLLEGYLYSFS
jgi:hypothetical protein